MFKRNGISEDEYRELWIRVGKGELTSAVAHEILNTQFEEYLIEKVARVMYAAANGGDAAVASGRFYGDDWEDIKSWHSEWKKVAKAAIQAYEDEL